MNLQPGLYSLLAQINYGDGIYGEGVYGETPGSLPNTANPWQWGGLVLIGLLFIGLFLLFRRSGRRRLN